MWGRRMGRSLSGAAGEKQLKRREDGMKRKSGKLTNKDEW